MVKSTCLGLLLTALLIGGGAYAETFQIDLDASTATVEQTMQASEGDTVVANLVISDAENLLGMSADILFDATNALTLKDIQATFGDLNFDSQVAYQELFDLIAFYVNATDQTTLDDFVDSNGNNSGVVVDKDRDETFSYAELFSLISQYVTSDTGVQYWTTELVNDTDRSSHQNESVPVFDPVAKSNVGGEHPGLIEDITAVLLRRPDGSEGGTVATDFGFDSSKYGNAIICTLTFEVKTGAPASTELSFGKSVYISEDFADISQDINTGTAESSTISVQ